jgi:hypothetical protein
MFVVSGNHNTKRSASGVAVGRGAMRDERTAFGMSGRGGSKAFVTTVGAMLACLAACGSITAVPPGSTQLPFQQATGLVTRTECSGWAEDDVDKLDGVDVNCPPGNLVSNGGVVATVCYQNLEPNPTAAQQQAEAQTACNSYCEGGSFIGTYPLGSVANKGGAVTCQSTEQSFANEVAGQCSKVTPAADAGPPAATTFALCQLSGRACDATPTVPSGTKQAADGTNYCVSMPPVGGGQSTSGCFDPTATTAELFCQHMIQFPKTLPTFGVNSNGTANNSVQFPFWAVDQVEPNATATDCQNVATGIGFESFGIPAGPIGSFTMKGTTTSLTAKGGFAKIGTTCGADNEFCVPTIGSMKIELADVTIAGLTFHNPEATLVAPAIATFGTPNLPVNALQLEIEGDVTAIGRAKTVFSNAQPLTLTSTSTTASLSGSLSATVNTSLQGVALATGNISVTASSTTTACGNETQVQQLLGFETTADWSSSQASLALTSTHTEGCFGMQVGGGGYRTLNSVPFATPLPGTTHTLALDFFNPPNPPNPLWLGAVQMYLTCPSANFFNQYIGEDELTGLPLNKFSTLNYPIPGPIASMLQGSHPDCFFSIAVNTNQTPTPPILDNLRFK